MVELDAGPTRDEGAANTLETVPAVEHVIRTVGGAVLRLARADRNGVRDLLADVLDEGSVRELSVRPVADATWTVVRRGPDRNRMRRPWEAVDSGGVSVELGDRTGEVWYPSCVTGIESQYDELERAAESD